MDPTCHVQVLSVAVYMWSVVSLLLIAVAAAECALMPWMHISQLMVQAVL